VRDPYWRQAIAEDIQALEKMKPGNLKIFYQERNSLVVNGFTQLNIILMEPYNATKLDWSFKAIFKSKALIITKHLRRWQR